MQEFLFQNYLWLKAFHLIAVISWMAGLLYLPRLFVYHAGVETGSAQSELFKIMERRLLKFIMAPASLVAWIFGGLMLYADPGLFSQPWIHVKLLCVVLMTGAHHAMMAYAKRFARDANGKSQKFFRILNEIPTVLMIIIVVMVIVRPL